MIDLQSNEKLKKEKKKKVGRFMIIVNNQTYIKDKEGKHW